MGGGASGIRAMMRIVSKKKALGLDTDSALFITSEFIYI